MLSKLIQRHSNARASVGGSTRVLIVDDPRRDSAGETTQPQQAVIADVTHTRLSMSICGCPRQPRCIAVLTAYNVWFVSASIIRYGHMQTNMVFSKLHVIPWRPYDERCIEFEHPTFLINDHIQNSGGSQEQVSTRTTPEPGSIPYLYISMHIPDGMEWRNTPITPVSL